MTSITIVIVNWNSGRQLVECVNSVLQFEDGLVDQIIVVDNKSSDNSMKLLPSKSFLKPIFANRNLGFAKACNLGASHANSKYLLFLNPDAKLKQDTLKTVIDFMESEAAAKVGICGVKILDENGLISKNCARFPTLKTWLGKSLVLNKVFPALFLNHFMSDFDHKTSRMVDQVMGAFFFIRKELFEQLNGYDEQFFVYFEDLDLALRTKNSGFTSHYLAETHIFHKGGGVSEQVKAHRLFYSLRSRFLYCFKHYPAWQAWLVVVLALFPELLARIGRAFLRFSFQEGFDTMRAYLWLCQDLPKILKVALKNA